MLVDATVRSLHQFRRCIVSALLIAIYLIPHNAYCDASSLIWSRQFGTSDIDLSWGVSADSFGNAYIVGSTEGALDGASSGNADAFLRKFNASGDVLWTRQMGTGGDDQSYSVSSDNFGGVYISGQTPGDLAQTSAGHFDVFAAKFGANGDPIWSQQWGSSGPDHAHGIAADSFGNTFVSGYTGADIGDSSFGKHDGFVSKLDPNGNLLWTRQFGTSADDAIQGVATDNFGNVYVTGYTEGNLASPLGGLRDAFVRKYDEDGAVLWTKQFGTSSRDSAAGIDIDSQGNVYLSGSTDSNLGGMHLGDYDMFLRKLDADGNHVWTRQLGSSGIDASLGVTAIDDRFVYLSGWTLGSVDGSTSGSYDAIIAGYSAAGELILTHQFGTSGIDAAYGISADGQGAIYIAGNTNGDLVGSNAGMEDVFLLKFAVVPEPSTLVLMAISGAAIFGRLMRP